jgi:hypothetical protein
MKRLVAYMRAVHLPEFDTISAAQGKARASGVELWQARITFSQLDELAVFFREGKVLGVDLPQVLQQSIGVHNLHALLLLAFEHYHHGVVHRACGEDSPVSMWPPEDEVHRVLGSQPFAHRICNQQMLSNRLLVKVASLVHGLQTW